MTRKTIALAFALLFAAGCSERETATPVPTAASEPSPAGEAKARPVLGVDGGYTPGFPHQLRSQRHVPAGNGFRHVVVVEYLGVGAEEVLSTLQADLSARGFSVDPPMAKGQAYRVVATKKRSSLVVDVSNSPDVQLNAANARGTAYFTWMDRNPR